jgi:phosphoribosylpyrophosphate synthetase
MIMKAINKAIMSGLIAASAIIPVGASANAAVSPYNVAAHQSRVHQKSEPLKKSQYVHKAAWSQQDQQKFWEEEEDRGG